MYARLFGSTLQRDRIISRTAALPRHSGNSWKASRSPRSCGIRTSSVPCLLPNSFAWEPTCARSQGWINWVVLVALTLSHKQRTNIADNGGEGFRINRTPTARCYTLNVASSDMRELTIGVHLLTHLCSAEEYKRSVLHKIQGSIPSTHSMRRMLQRAGRAC